METRVGITITLVYIQREQTVLAASIHRIPVTFKMYLVHLERVGWGLIHCVVQFMDATLLLLLNISCVVSNKRILSEKYSYRTFLFHKHYLRYYF